MEIKFGHCLEDMASPFSVGLWIGRDDEKVVHVDDEPSFSNHILEGVIHESLERSRRVAKAEEHDSGFKKSFVCDEGCFPLVAVFDADIVVSPTNIELSEVASIFQLVHEVRDEGKGVGVIGGVFIEVVVVLAGVELAILLLDKEERDAWGELEGRIFPVAKFSSRKSSVAFFSSGESG